MILILSGEHVLTCRLTVRRRSTTYCGSGCLKSLQPSCCRFLLVSLESCVTTNHRRTRMSAVPARSRARQATATAACVPQTLQSQMVVIDRPRDRGLDAGLGQIAELLPGNDLCRLPGGGKFEQRRSRDSPFPMTRFFWFLPEGQKQLFLENLTEKPS